MKCSCVLKRLAENIALIEGVVGKKESLPVLSCIYIEVKKTGIVLQATNLETSARVTVSAQVDEEGVVAVPAQVLLHTLQSSRGEKVTLEKKGENISIKTETGTTTIKAIPHQEFPSMGKVSTPHVLKKEVLKKGIQNVGYAASQSLIRPELASIFMTYRDGVVVFAATDSFRLAEKTFHTPIKNEIPDTLIPYKNASEIAHILDKVDDEDLSIGFDEAQLQLSIGNLTVISRTIEAAFPDYRTIIPKEFTAEATLLKEDLVTTFKKTKIFSNKTQQIGFHIYPKQKTFTITASNSDIGETSDNLQAAVSGEDLDINFNLHYLVDCLSSVATDSVVLQFAGPGKPLVIQGVSDKSFTYLVMPLNR